MVQKLGGSVPNRYSFRNKEVHRRAGIEKELVSQVD